jgi:hypothetical protein
MFDCTTRREIHEQEYFEMLRTMYNDRNPHAPIGGEFSDLN